MRRSEPGPGVKLDVAAEIRPREADIWDGQWRAYSFTK